jgi:hypothetical protein
MKAVRMPCLSVVTYVDLNKSAVGQGREEATPMYPVGVAVGKSNLEKKKKKKKIYIYKYIYINIYINIYKTPPSHQFLLGGFSHGNNQISI